MKQKKSKVRKQLIELNWRFELTLSRGGLGNLHKTLSGVSA